MLNPFTMFSQGSQGTPASTNQNANTTVQGNQQGAAPANKTDVNPTTGMPNNPNPGAGQGADGTGATDGGTGGTGNNTSSPLDSFTDLFKVDDKKQQPVNPLSEKLLNLDPAKLSAAVAKMNFTSGITAEQMQKALGGDVQAFSTTINQASQNAFAMAITMVTNMTEAAFSKNNDRFNSTLGDRFKEHSLRFQRPSNAALNHPAAQPMIEAMKTMISGKEPSLSPADVTQRAEEYFLAMADSIGKSKTGAAGEDKGGAGADKAVDWTQFLAT